MSDAKYIVFENPMAGETPIVFPCYLNHNDIAAKFGWPVLSAGFVSVSNNGTAQAYGKSTSLDVGVGEHDTYYLNKMLNP